MNVVERSESFNDLFFTILDHNEIKVRDNLLCFYGKFRKEEIFLFGIIYNHPHHANIHALTNQ